LTIGRGSGTTFLTSATKGNETSSPRTDVHSPSNIIPAHYSHILSYNLPSSQDGWPVPSSGINCELDYRNPETGENGKHSQDGLCCIIGIRHIAKGVFGGKWDSTGKCSVCGANFVYGDVWRHGPTGEFVHQGHTCAAKYEMLADRSAWELKLGRLQAAAAKAVIRARNEEERREFLSANPGLEAALALKDKHSILADLGDKFSIYRGLSEKQVALALKLAHEVNNPEAAEPTVPAPIQSVRQTFRGVVVSVKDQEGQYGTSWKVTVKVQTDAGVWLAWGTLPASILDANRAQGRTARALKGAVLEMTATLKPGRDAHFALMDRPKGSIVAEPPAPAVAA
jgi:hypothetical protein